MRLCILAGKQFENTFDNTQRRKGKQLQPVWLCILSCRRVEESFENTRWIKTKQKWQIKSAEPYILHCEFKKVINYWSCDETGDTIKIFVYFCLWEWDEWENVIFFYNSWIKNFTPKTIEKHSRNNKCHKGWNMHLIVSWWNMHLAATNQETRTVWNFG